MNYITTIGEQRFAIEINDENHVTVDGAEIEVDWHPLPGQPVYSVLIGGRSFEAYLLPIEGGFPGADARPAVRGARGGRTRIAPARSLDDNLPASSEYQLRAPMPGLVAAVPVAEGQTVEKGTVLIVLESMKMQNELKTPRAGRVAHIRVRAGQAVEQNQTLVVVE
jgi:biotin carboxyl carrier protein